MILCGGLGTRLRPVAKGPKALAPLGKEPFLVVLINDLLQYGFRRFILCTGHQGGQIKRFVQGKSEWKKHGIQFIFSEEKKPLGTGGALKLALPLVASKNFVVINGDTLLRFNFPRFLVAHSKRGALVSMALLSSQRTDAGRVQIAKGFKIKDFSEKPDQTSKGYINAGAYVMQTRVVDHLPPHDIFSLENDFFPKVIGKKFYGFLMKGSSHDIGTPERFAEAQKLV